MSGLPPPPPGTDLSANRSASLLASTAVTFVFAFTGVVLRFVTRYCSGAGYWLDDWLMIPAIAIVIGIVGVASRLDYIFGQHVWTVGYPAQIFYNTLLTVTKLSVLALYWRVFHVTKIRIPIIIMAFVVVAWYIASLLSTILECHPISKDFNIILPGTCLDIKALYLGNAIANIITDGIILALPMPPIFKIHKPLSQKLLIAGTFLCGGLIIVVSCLRLHYMTEIDLSSIDLTWNYTDVFIWSAVEVNVAVFSACLPTLRPFYKYLRTGSFKDPASPAASRTVSGSFGRTLPPRAYVQEPKQWEDSNGDDAG